jgi:hypothetical protein
MAHPPSRPAETCTDLLQGTLDMLIFRMMNPDLVEK